MDAKLFLQTPTPGTWLPLVLSPHSHPWVQDEPGSPHIPFSRLLTEVTFQFLHFLPRPTQSVLVPPRLILRWVGRIRVNPGATAVPTSEHLIAEEGGNGFNPAH